MGTGLTRGRAGTGAVAVALAGAAGLMGMGMPGAGTVLAGGDAPAARVFAVDDEVRLRRADGARAAALGQPLDAGGGATISVSALRGETLAFQLVVIAGDRPLERVNGSLSAFAGGDGAPTATPDSGARPRAELFRAHYLNVDARSRNDRRAGESLGWTAGARPPDDQVRGQLPDALIPIAVDPAPVVAPPEVPAGQTGVLWLDIEIPEATAPGAYVASGTVTARAAGVPPAPAAAIARFTVHVQVAPATLPYRATSVFVFYEADRLGLRTGRPGPSERQLWRLLHAHHIDALAPLIAAADVERLRAVYDASLFAPDADPAGDGYTGAGAGRGPAVIALGAYGTLGAPSPAAITRARMMGTTLDGARSAAPPTGAPAPDVFVYAIDESCASPRAGDWTRALAEPANVPRLLVGQTCNDPVDRQPVDVALVSAEGFSRATPAAARAAGKRAWIYNGLLPRTGTLLLDADPRGLIANGWIAAVMNIERWFYWESIFWDDDNRGGHGAIDPFTTAETFHNRDGDAALGDGLLLYPGRQQGAFAARSLGVDGVLPSIRLKLLRRGIEDAGLIALAAREDPDQTARVVAQVVPAALDEARLDRPASWQSAPLSFGAGRAALRRLIRRVDPLSPRELPAIFADLAARRDRLVPLAPSLRALRLRHKLIVAGGAAAALIAIGLLAAWALVARRRGRHTSGS